MSTSTCPCGSGEEYASCCGRFHSGAARAPTAELLMRSRFSAFAMNDADYLARTWHPRTRPSALTLDTSRRWTRLEIVASRGGGLLDAEGSVDFRAHYRHDGEHGVQQENSAFVREKGYWLYVGPLLAV